MTSMKLISMHLLFLVMIFLGIVLYSESGMFFEGQRIIHYLSQDSIIL